MDDEGGADRATVARFVIVVAALAGIFSAAALATTSTFRIDGGSARATMLTADEGRIRNGALTLSDDDDGSALFRAGELLPGHPVTACTKIVYTGEVVPANIKFHASSEGALAGYLDVTVEVGTGGSFGECAGFVPTATIYQGTLDELASTHSDWASGLATFTAEDSPTTRTVRFIVDVQSDDAAQGTTTSAGFRWATRGVDEYATVGLDPRGDQVTLADGDGHGLEL